MGIWRYKLSETTVIESEKLRRIKRFETDWVLIEDGEMTIQKGYAWDGCTPSYPTHILGLWVGIWDGPLGIDCRPVTWKASLGHDVLCQYREVLQGMSKDNSVGFFKELLVRNLAPAWMAKLYPAAVYRFGPQKWLGC